MRIWLLKPGEPVWSDGEDVRLHRTGSLAEYLAKDGHDVVWWTSTFYHPRKIHRFSTDTTLTHGDRIRIEMLHSPGYPKNVSLRRLFDHRKLAQAFRERTRTADRPDLIVTALPTIEFCVESVEYGRRSGVPVVIDVRDLWPDTFVDVLPRALRPVARQAVRPYVAGARLALRSADGIVAMSQGCLAWGLNLAGRPGRDTDRVFPLGYRGTTPDTGADHPETTDLIRRGVDPTKLICWFIGTFGRMYDIGTIIEGARRCARAGRADVQFVISGEGDQRERWITLARGLDNVVFTGWLESREIHYMMSIADIGLVAIDTIPQALPNKVFEYFSAGLPVLSSLGGEAARLIQDERCGINYKAGDPESFMQALSILLDDPVARAGYGRNAARVFTDGYRAEKVYTDMVEYLVAIASAHGKTVPHPRDSLGGTSIR